MSDSGNRQVELSEQFEEEERARRIDAIRADLLHDGSDQCADCGDPIDVARRMAMPSATCCVDCQADRERVRR